MARSLLDEFSSLLTPDLLGRAATAFGETPDGIRKALGAAAPALLAGALGRASEARGGRELLGFVNDPASSPNLLSEPSALFGPERADGSLASLGNRFVTSLFGSRTESVASAVRQASGVQPSTASALLSIAASVVLGLLGRRVRSDGLDAAGLASLLGSQRESILNALPPGLGSALSVSGLRDYGTAAASAAAPGRRALWPIAAAIALLLGAWWLFRTFGGERQPASAPPVATAPAPTAPPPAVSAPAPREPVFERTLPSGFLLRAPEPGIERKLVLFLEDESRPPSDETWFEFDRVLFETGSAALKPESREQLRNVSEVLKAYPDAKVKIGGYTDDSGDPAANLRLSSDRASSVMTELAALGISADRLEAEGYGSQHPVADNATEEGRAKNRRIALRVTDK